MEQKEIFMEMALQLWETQISRTGKLLNTLGDDQLAKEITTGKNRGIYIIGHLIAIHDAMNEILGLGKRAHTELDEAFVKNPDKSGFPIPSIDTLKQYWNDVHQNLTNSFKQVSAEDWFKKHNAITGDDFAKEPARNKLSVLLNRTNHAAYHLGQLRLLTPAAAVA